jgi:membrane-associated phospholipid phosphatase
MDTALLWGLPIITGLQSLGTFLVLPMKVLSFLGTEEFFLLVMPGMVWCVDASLGLRMGLVLLTSASFNSMLKIAFGWPRPFWVSDAVTAHAFESSYGFPSGHAQASMVLWGRMAAGLRRRAWVIGLGLLIFLISLSRLYLGVHFPSDVLAGWVVGGILLALFLLLEKPVGAWIGRQTLGLQLVIPLLAALVIIGKGAWMSAATADRVVPAEWIARSTAAFPDEPPINPQALDVVSSAGTLFGLGTGAVLLRRWGKFSAKGGLGARAARFALGLVGVLLIYFGLRLILPSGEGLLPQSLRFVRYALVGLWVAYLAPWVFVRLRLA